MIADLALPVALTARGGHLTLRRAEPTDLAAVVGLLSDDTVSASRGDRADPADLPRYEKALRDVIGDPSNDILVAVDTLGEVVAPCSSRASRAWPDAVRHGCWSRRCACRAGVARPASAPP